MTVTREIGVFIPTAHVARINKVFEAQGYGPETLSKEYRPAGGGAVIGKWGSDILPLAEADVREAMADGGGTVPTHDKYGAVIDWDALDGEGERLWPTLGQRTAACAALRPYRNNDAQATATANIKAALAANNFEPVPEPEI